MKKIALFAFTTLLFCASCKKQTVTSSNLQLYPLAIGNKWIYADSFFNDRGLFYGIDTFTLKTVKTINFNDEVYTPITDQYDDSIFILRSTDTTVFMLKQPVEPLLFSLPISEVQPVIINSYPTNFLNSIIYTQRITNTNYPSYKILITYDDGQRSHYKQQELFFTPGIGIIKGRDIRKNTAGVLYAYDSYRLISYSLY